MVTPYKGKFKVTQEYKGSSHQGLDLVGLDSKNLYSIFDGIIEIASNADPNGFGIYVRMKITSGTYSGSTCYYGHMSSVSVKVGQQVKVGDLLGVEGSTGRSTGSHCHLEVRKSASNISSCLNISEITGIPNKIHTNDNVKSDNGGKEEMTQQQFNEMFTVAMKEYEKSKALEPGSAWSAENRDWAIKNNLIVGDDSGNFMWKANMSREQVVALMFRLLTFTLDQLKNMQTK